MLLQRMMQAAAANRSSANSNATPIENVFSAYTYAGTMTGKTVVNSIDLANRGGLVWVKRRNSTDDNALMDTIRGVNYWLKSNTTEANTSASGIITAFNSNGFSVNGLTATDGGEAASWTFAVAPKFFYQAQATVSGGVTATVDLSSLGTVGMVTVKRTDSTSAWFVYHRSCTSGKLVYLNTTAAETTDGSVTLSGTTLSLVGGTIANGTYIVYAWAHDTSTNGLIQCGSYAGDSTSGHAITLGWEPQYLLIFNYQSGAGYSWNGVDSSRIFSQTDYGYLQPNSSNAESSGSAAIAPTATGFALNTTHAAWNATGNNYIYLAIRRGPMHRPTLGTQVYNAVLSTGTGVARSYTGVGFPPDLVIDKERGGSNDPNWTDRLRGAKQELLSDATNAEATFTNDLLSFDMDGFSVGSSVGGYFNLSGHTNVNWAFRRYPGVFDVVCHSNPSNVTINHNLAASPELVIYKRRDSTSNWHVTYAPFTNRLKLDTTDANVALGGTPVATTTTFNDAGQVFNAASGVIYLFATLAGISKVGNYTGNGGSQTINCGFSTGARFVIIKRTDSTGDWYVWDSTRGIVAGNDGHVSLNTTAAEVTTDDSIDPDNAGFIVNEITATHINVSTATYIYLAFA